MLLLLLQLAFEKSSVATTTDKPKLNNLPLTETRVSLRKNSSKQVNDDCSVDYYSKGVYPDLI
jgi:hypothetical protein